MHDEIFVPYVLCVLQEIQYENENEKWNADENV